MAADSSSTDRGAPRSSSEQTQDIEKAPTAAAVAANQRPTDTIDANIVDWDGPDDPENPQNW